jgi:hypothetical protein
VGVTNRKLAAVLQGRSESEEFSFHAEESAPLPGEKISVEGQREKLRNHL